MDARRYEIVWAPEAVAALAAIKSVRKRDRIIQRVDLTALGPGLHRPRPTATWGTVYLIVERPFVIVYRYTGHHCEVLDVVDAAFMASYEIKE